MASSGWTQPLTLVGQPFWDFGTGGFRHLEVLSRIAGADGAPIAPPAYWASALAAGPEWVAVLDRHVFQSALARPPATRGRLFINVWPPSVLQHDLPWGDASAPQVTHTALELSEMHEWSTAAWRSLKAYRALGGWIALDDVGAGRDGLTMMATLAPDVVKVDRILIDGVSRSAGQAAVVRHLVQMAHDVGARAVAEGVERPEDAAWCADAGFDWGQGYLWARPAPWTVHQGGFLDDEGSEGNEGANARLSG